LINAASLEKINILFKSFFFCNPTAPEKRRKRRNGNFYFIFYEFL